MPESRHLGYYVHVKDKATVTKEAFSSGDDPETETHMLARCFRRAAATCTQSSDRIFKKTETMSIIFTATSKAAE